MASAVTAGGDADVVCRSILSRSILIIADAFSFNFVSVALDFVSLSLDFGLCSGYMCVCVGTSSDRFNFLYLVFNFVVDCVPESTCIAMACY